MSEDATSSACPPLTEVGEAQREPAPRSARNRPTAQVGCEQHTTWAVDEHWPQHATHWVQAG